MSIDIHFKKYINIQRCITINQIRYWKMLDLMKFYDVILLNREKETQKLKVSKRKKCLHTSVSKGNVVPNL